MANSVKFKDIESFDKLDERVRYREDVRGEVSIYDEKADNWIQVFEGDKIERYGNGYTVVKEG